MTQIKNISVAKILGIYIGTRIYFFPIFLLNQFK